MGGARPRSIVLGRVRTCLVVRDAAGQDHFGDAMGATLPPIVTYDSLVLQPTEVHYKHTTMSVIDGQAPMHRAPDLDRGGPPLCCTQEQDCTGHSHAGAPVGPARPASVSVCTMALP
jgi:hypothetical protein